MERIRVVGVCLIAMFAMSAVSAASASAEAPEYGRCKAVAGGKYKNSGCTTASVPGEEKYEWYPGFEGAKLGYTTKLKPLTTATLETVKGDKVVCTGETGVGALAGSHYSIVENTTFTGCASGGFACQSPEQPAGTIATLRGQNIIGWINQSLKKVGAFRYFYGFQFSCAGGTLSGLTVRIQNTGPVAPVKSGVMVKTQKVKYSGQGGKQIPKEMAPYESFRAGIFKNEEFVREEEVGLTAVIVQTNEEKFEINPVV